MAAIASLVNPELANPSKLVVPALLADLASQVGHMAIEQVDPTEHSGMPTSFALELSTLCFYQPFFF